MEEPTRVACDICHRTFKSKDSKRQHIKRQHKTVKRQSGEGIDLRIHPKTSNKIVNDHLVNNFESPIEYPIDLHIQAPESATDNTLDFHFHQHTTSTESVILDKYLKDRNNRYDAKDFDNYLKEMKTKDKKYVKVEPYARPEEDGEGGPSGGNVGELSICHICDEEFSSQKARGEHMDRRHPLCSLCNDRFKSVDKLKHHFEIFHPPNVNPMKLVLKPTSTMRLNDSVSQSVQSQGTNISLLELESQPESNVSKDPVLAITPHSDASLEMSSQETDSQDSEMTILVIESETETQDSTSVTSYQKDTPDYVESGNSFESIDTIIDNSEDISDDQKHSQVKKCRFCGDKFLRKSFLYDHIKEKHKKNKHRQVRNKHANKKCPFCNETPSYLKLHIRQEHSFSCTGCRIRFKNKKLLLEHISLEHPTCKVCSKTFNTKRELLIHQKDHPEERFDIEETTDEETTDEDDSDESENQREDREFYENINCVAIERFVEIRELITKNDFKTLSKNKKLLKGLSIIMNGVKNGFIQICSAQRLVLTNSQKELVYRLAKSSTGHLVMKERQDLSLLFDVLWDSVKQVSATFLKYNQ